MITKLTHVSIYVLDQASAYDFYTNKLGFKVITNVPMGNGHRWLTVAPPDHPDFEINLTPITGGMWYSKEGLVQGRFRELVLVGAVGEIPGRSEVIIELMRSK